MQPGAGERLEQEWTLHGDCGLIPNKLGTADQTTSTSQQGIWEQNQGPGF